MLLWQQRLQLYPLLQHLLPAPNLLKSRSRVHRKLLEASLCTATCCSPGSREFVLPVPTRTSKLHAYCILRWKEFWFSQQQSSILQKSAMIARSHYEFRLKPLSSPLIHTLQLRTSFYNGIAATIATHLLRNILSNYWCGMHRTCKNTSIKPDRNSWRTRNEKLCEGNLSMSLLEGSNRSDAARSSSIDIENRLVGNSMVVLGLATSHCGKLTWKMKQVRRWASPSISQATDKCLC